MALRLSCSYGCAYPKEPLDGDCESGIFVGVRSLAVFRQGGGFSLDVNDDRMQSPDAIAPYWQTILVTRRTVSFGTQTFPSEAQVRLGSLFLPEATRGEFG